MADKDRAPTQADFDKAWANIKAGKGRMPMEDDMGPLPETNKAKGIELKLGPSKKDKPTDLNPVAKKKGGSVKAKCKCMAKGGYVKAADGIATKGKTRGRLI